MSDRTHDARSYRAATARPPRTATAAAALVPLVFALLSACSGGREDDGFRLFREKADANPAIWLALSPKGIDTVADPGQPCELGCVRTWLYPDRCLRFGGQSKTHVFLVYRQGTIFLRTMLVVFELQGDKANIVWQSDLGSYPADGIPGLREALAEGISREQHGVEGKKLFKADGARTGVSNYASTPSAAGSECPETNE